MNFGHREAPETDHKVQVPRASSDRLADRKDSAHLVDLANSDLLPAMMVLDRRLDRVAKALAHGKARQMSLVRQMGRGRMVEDLEDHKVARKGSGKWGGPEPKVQTPSDWSTMPCSLMRTVTAN